MEIKIIRLEKSPTEIRGVLLIDGRLQCVTLENAELAMPVGRYIGKVFYSNKFKTVTLEIQVPGHQGVIFHVGNTHIDSTGCVLVGRYYGFCLGERAILDSKKGFLDLKLAFFEESQESYEVIIEDYKRFKQWLIRVATKTRRFFKKDA